MNVFQVLNLWGRQPQPEDPEPASVNLLSADLCPATSNGIYNRNGEAAALPSSLESSLHVHILKNWYFTDSLWPFDGVVFVRVCEPLAHCAPRHLSSRLCKEQRTRFAFGIRAVIYCENDRILSSKS